MLNRATALLNFADADAQFQRRYCSISPAEALNFNAVCNFNIIYALSLNTLFMVMCLLLVEQRYDMPDTSQYPVYISNGYYTFGFLNCNRQINHRIALHPENVRKYKQKRSVRL